MPKQVLYLCLDFEQIDRPLHHETVVDRLLSPEAVVALRSRTVSAVRGEAKEGGRGFVPGKYGRRGLI